MGSDKWRDNSSSLRASLNYKKRKCKGVSIICCGREGHRPCFLRAFCFLLWFPTLALFFSFLLYDPGPRFPCCCFGNSPGPFTSLSSRAFLLAALSASASAILAATRA